MKTQLHIEIAVTKIKSLSSMSSKSSTMIKNALQKHYTKVGIYVVNSVEDLERLADSKPDVVFIGFKKIPKYGLSPETTDYNIWIAQYLADRGILTTGSPSTAIKLEQNKEKAKDAVLAAGFATSPYFVASTGQYKLESDLPIDFPLFLKPPNQGAGAGVDAESVVRTFAEYEAKILSLSEENGSDALVEKYYSGREFTVALMRDSATEKLLIMPIEQLPLKNSRGDAVIGHAMKESDTETAVSLIENEVIKQAVSTLAHAVFTTLGARDYGRIDMRLDEYGVPHFLEANLIPGLIDGSGNFQKACEMNIGMKHEEMIVHLVELARNR
jgi:D-alanine-D-alanine ligase